MLVNQDSLINCYLYKVLSDTHNQVFLLCLKSEQSSHNGIPVKALDDWYVDFLIVMSKIIFKLIHLFSLFQVRINLNEKNDMAAIKNYLTTDLESAGPEPPRKGLRGSFFRGFPKLAKRRNARRAFREIYQRLKEESFGNRPNISNICLLLVNEKRTSRYLKNSEINRFCDHTLVFSGEDEIDLAAIRKKICPEAQIIRGMCD